MNLEELCLEIYGGGSSNSSSGSPSKSKLLEEVEKVLDKAAGVIQSENDNLEGSEQLNRLERVREAKGAFNWNLVHSFLSPYEGRFGKNAQVSTLLREKGNKLYQQKDGKAALRAYSLAVAFAPSAAEQLPTAYANRSAVLLQMKGRAREALQDIDRATSHPKGPPQLKDKLKERKSKCEALLLKVESGSNPPTLIDKSFEIHSPNPKVVNADEFVEIAYSEERGRHLIVTKEIPAGTTLLIDLPFVSVMDKLTEWDTEHCHHCSLSVLNPVPCSWCTFAMFCGEKCRDAACNGVHRYEHDYLSLLHSLDSSHAELQALRILAKVGVPQLHQIFLTAGPSLFVKGGVKNICYNAEGVYDVSSYLPVFHLISYVSRSKETSPRAPAATALKAVLLKEVLREYSDFFSGPYAGDEEFEDFIAALLLKHLESIPYNSIGVSKLVDKTSVPYASAIYPLISLCNHSCDPNCAPVRRSSFLQTSLIALKRLNTGEELSITYKPLYTLMKRAERQRFLAENFRFICRCEACEGNWGPTTVQPVVEGATIVLEPTRCDACSGGEGQQRQCHVCVVADVDRARQVEAKGKELLECHEMLENQQYDQCIQRLPAVIDFFGVEGFRSHFPLYSVALDLFKRAIVYSVQKNY